MNDDEGLEILKSSKKHPKNQKDVSIHRAAAEKIFKLKKKVLQSTCFISMKNE